MLVITEWEILLCWEEVISVRGLAHTMRPVVAVNNNVPGHTESGNIENCGRSQEQGSSKQSCNRNLELRRRTGVGDLLWGSISLQAVLKTRELGMPIFLITEAQNNETYYLLWAEPFL